MEKEDLKQNYADMLIYEVAKIKEVGLTDKVLVSYITTSIAVQMRGTLSLLIY